MLKSLKNLWDKVRPSHLSSGDPQIDNLAAIMRDNPVIVFGEAHFDENLPELYKMIFEAASHAGIKDVAIERAPQFQGKIDSLIDIAKQGILEFGCEDLL